MGLNKLLAISAFLIISLTGCGSQSVTKSNSFDANADIAAIQEAVKYFDDLSESVRTDSSLENVARVAKLNTKALDDIESSTKTFLNHLIENWDSIGSGDSPKGLSREVLKEWSEAYLFWVSKQRQIQEIAELCLENLETFVICNSQKVEETRALERESVAPLNAAQIKINAWQEKYSNG